jgi:hypothetical protein
MWLVDVSAASTLIGGCFATNTVPFRSRLLYLDNLIKRDEESRDNEHG